MNTNFEHVKQHLDSDGEDNGYDWYEFTSIEGTHLCHVEYVCSICGLREDNP